MLTQSSEPTEISGNISQTIGLTDSVVLASIFRLASDRVFFFGANAPTGQAASHNYFYEDATNTFSFVSISGFNQEFDVKQYLGFTDRFFAPAIQQTLFGPLGFGSKVAESFVVDATNNFSFFRHDSPFNEALKRAQTLGNVFSFTSSAIIQSRIDVDQEFTWSSVVDSASSSYGRQVNQIGIKQNLTYHITGSDCPAEKIYRPFVGDGDDGNFTPPSEVPPTLSDNTMKFELNIPPAPTTTLVLKNPEFQNVDELQFTRIDRKTRGGDRKLFSDQDWGQLQTLRLRVEKLCDKDADEIINFLNASMGRTVTLFDWENRQWSGLISSSNTDVFTDENETTTFDIVFDGALL